VSSEFDGTEVQSFQWVTLYGRGVRKVLINKGIVRPVAFAYY